LNTRRKSAAVRSRAARGKPWSVSDESADTGRGASGGQARASLGSTSVDDLATTTRRHTGTESVGTGTFQAAGLKSTFHDASCPRLRDSHSAVRSDRPPMAGSVTITTTTKGREKYATNTILSMSVEPNFGPSR
jgi:hypothetical protein